MVCLIFTCHEKHQNTTRFMEQDHSRNSPDIEEINGLRRGLKNFLSNVYTYIPNKKIRRFLQLKMYLREQTFHTKERRIRYILRN